MQDGFDTDASNPTSRLLLHIFAALADFEREMTRERVIAGMGAAKRRGKNWQTEGGSGPAEDPGHASQG
jgi:DNA invertase Pin-like site-specific DNA recombinase